MYYTYVDTKLRDNIYIYIYIFTMLCRVASMILMGHLLCRSSSPRYVLLLMNNEHAFVAFSRRANACTNWSATYELFDASLFTQLIVGVLSSNSAAVFSVRSPQPLLLLAILVPPLPAPISLVFFYRVITG